MVNLGPIFEEPQTCDFTYLAMRRKSSVRYIVTIAPAGDARSVRLR